MPVFKSCNYGFLCILQFFKNLLYYGRERFSYSWIDSDYNMHMILEITQSFSQESFPSISQTLVTAGKSG